MGVTGFFISGPLSYLLNQTLNRLYPGKGRLTGEFCISLRLWTLVLKRVAMTTSISPLVIGCGVLVSTWLFSRDIDKARVGGFSFPLMIISTMWSIEFPWVGWWPYSFSLPSHISMLVSWSGGIRRSLVTPITLCTTLLFQGRTPSLKKNSLSISSSNPVNCDMFSCFCHISFFAKMCFRSPTRGEMWLIVGICDLLNLLFD